MRCMIQRIVFEGMDDEIECLLVQLLRCMPSVFWWE